MKDDNGKITVNIVKQRPLARTLIEKLLIQFKTMKF